MQKYALMHREGLKGKIESFALRQSCDHSKEKTLN